MYGTFFANIAVTFAVLFGAGRDDKDGLLSQKCPQTGSVCKQKNL